MFSVVSTFNTYYSKKLKFFEMRKRMDCLNGHWCIDALGNF